MITRVKSLYVLNMFFVEQAFVKMKIHKLNWAQSFLVRVHTARVSQILAGAGDGGGAKSKKIVVLLDITENQWDPVKIHLCQNSEDQDAAR